MILVTGRLWVGSGRRLIGAVIKELAMKAEHEAILTLYTAGEVISPLRELIEVLLKKGILTVVIVNRWSSQPEILRRTLLSMKRAYPDLLRIFSFESGEGDLHAKAFVVDRSKAVVGSSNITLSGMHYNYEIAVLVEGREAEEVARLLYALIRSPLCREIPGLGDVSARSR